MGWQNMANALVGLERYEDAASALESAVKLGHQFPDLYAKLGSAYLKAGSDDKALAAYQKALDLT